MIPRLRQNDNPRLLKRLSPAEKLKLGISDGGGGGATTFDASAIISGTMAVARLGSGTANGTTVLYGDNTWAAPPGAGSGTPVGVDGAAALASADLNSTTPAAPAGSLNVDFQVSGTSVSAFTKTDNASLEINASAIRRAALTGDVTATAGSNATTIANDAVTYAKMQNVSATDKLLGRSTAGAGDVEEIACTAAGRAILDDADAAAQRTTLGAAATSHTHAEADVTNLVADLAAKAPLASPTFTGVPAAPTAAFADNTTQLATTAHVRAGYVQINGAGYAAPTQLGNAGTPGATTYLNGVGAWVVPSIPTGTGYYHVTAGAMDAASVPDATLKTTVNTAPLFAAGTASANTAPRLTSGTLNTTPDPGAIEYDGSVFYESSHATLPGRRVSGDTTFFMLTGDQGTVGTTIADFFTSTSSYPTNTNGRYIFEFHLWFLKTTAGTATFTLTNTQAYTNCNIKAIYGPITGIQAAGAVQEVGIDKSTTAATALPATGSLSSAVEHYAHILAMVECGTAGNIRLRITQSAGTVTARRGCHYTVRQLGAANTGAFVA